MTVRAGDWRSSFQLLAVYDDPFTISAGGHAANSSPTSRGRKRVSRSVRKRRRAAALLEGSCAAEIHPARVSCACEGQNVLLNGEGIHETSSVDRSEVTGVETVEEGPYSNLTAISNGRIADYVPLETVAEVSSMNLIAKSNGSLADAGVLHPASSVDPLVSMQSDTAAELSSVEHTITLNGECIRESWTVDRSAVMPTMTVAEGVPSVTSCVSYVELRQRNVNANGSVGDMTSGMEVNSRESTASPQEPWHRPAVPNGSVARLGTEGSLDWHNLMQQDPNLMLEVSSANTSPFKYFTGEIYRGNSLRATISVGNEKKRQRVYNTMFHVPLRCERLIISGFLVCLESFLSLLTIMPARILMIIWRILRTRQVRRLDAAELADLGCFIVLTIGVTTLQLTDISIIYHFIRGQGTIKLYVLYNVLEVFDKLCQSFGEDVLQVLFNSADGLACCSPDNQSFELLQFIFDEAIAIVAFTVHSFILLAQAVTLSTCIIAHNNALPALLISNNFAEIKSNVFKRVSKENIHRLVCYDVVERFHITAFLLFVLTQNILEAEGPWFSTFLTYTLVVYMCEVFVDMIKHSFLAKFNEIKPSAYSEFLEDLCKQTLNDGPESRKNLTFIPIAPACLVIRVLAPIYATVLPFGPIPWRLLWIVFWSSLTYMMLAICKVLVGLSLRYLARWYLYQRQNQKQHMD